MTTQQTHSFQWLPKLSLAPIVSLFAFLSVSQCSHEAIAQDDGKLLKRISELEAENQALRKIIANIQSQLSGVPKKSASLNVKSNQLRIVVLPSQWGNSQIEDIRKVCISSAESLWSEMAKDDGLAPIHISRSQSGPISIFERGLGYEYRVKLDTQDRAWAQCAYQFAHEFCHILCNYRNATNRQLWFEESLCECASLFALRRMGETWKTKAPYSNWKSYSVALQKYAADRIKKYDDNSEPLIDFYRKNRAKFEASGNNRELNGYVACKLLPKFEKNPSAWQALRYINLGPKDENETFEKYLKGWHDRVPKVHKPFVKEVSAEFGFTIQ